MSGSSSKSSQSSRSSNTSVSIGIGGDNNGFIVDGNGNSFSQTDHGAIEGAYRVVDESFDVVRGSLESFTNATTDIANEAFLAVGNANDGANQLSERALSTVDDAMHSNQSMAETAILAVSGSNETIAQMAAENGGNITNLADNTIAAFQGTAELAMNNNSLLASQFGSDMLAMSDKNAELAIASMDNSKSLAGQFGVDMSNAYQNYSNNMSDAVTTTQTALTDMAVLQEKGLDNALQIAGSIATDDNSEASTKMVMYISIGLAVIGGAMVLKS